MRAGGIGSSRRIDSAVTLLPQPDSPTTASVSPGMHVERHAVDRAHDAVARVEMRLQVVDASKRFRIAPPLLAGEHGGGARRSGSTGLRGQP